VSGRPGGKLVLMSPEAAASAPAAPDGDGAAVLVAGEDAGAVGAAVARLRAAGILAAGFVGPASSPLVAEMAAELFPGLDLCPG
jgi:hypothetical protein